MDFQCVSNSRTHLLRLAQVCGVYRGAAPQLADFGGDALRTAFVTLSSSGRLVACDWPTPGLPLAYSV